MKRSYIITGIILIAILAAWIWAPYIILKMVTDYPVFTLERVLGDEYWRENYGINMNDHPDDYGYQNVEEVEFRSLDKRIQLSGWYVNSSNNNDKCIVLIHGRTSNRLKPMKYLKLFKQTGLDSIYDFFIPDLRNSGKSESAKTYMGYKFAEDILAGLQLIKEEKGNNQFILYGFSMGAMAIFNLIGRDDLKDSLQKNEIEISRLIIDSPLANVKEILTWQARNRNIPEFVFNRTYSLFNEQVSGNVENMRMSVLLKDYNNPILILHSKSDRLTPYSIMKREFDLMDKNNLMLKTFEDVGHVKIYQSEKYMVEYTLLVSDFVRSN